MNRSYFKLELDTTAPVIHTIDFPSLSMSSYEYLYIEADEDLDSWHEVYIIDSKKKRHDYTLAHEGNKLYGLIFVDNIASGIATIHVKVRDTVHNVSEVAKHHFNRDVHPIYFMKIMAFTRDVEPQRIEERTLMITTKGRDIKIATSSRSLGVDVTERELKPIVYSRRLWIRLLQGGNI